MSNRSVTLQEIKDTVKLALRIQLLSGNSTSDAHTSFDTIEASLSATFQALPKTQQGGISSLALAYLVRSYFAKEHGWHIHGLGTHMSNVSMSEMQSASILEEMAPAVVQNLIDTQSANHIFFLKDVVAMVATLEYLVISESTRMLEEIYEVEHVDEQTAVNGSSLLRLLVGYSMAFELMKPAQIPSLMSKILEPGLMYDHFVTPMQDIINNFEYARGHQSPFKKDYHFEDVVSMVTEHHKSYGRRQGDVCTSMKEELALRDASGMGRVPLHEFHAKTGPVGSIFEFSEGKEYLREIGALDESDPQRPKVIIPNYVQGPWNCLARSGYYAICCINECEGLMNAIEGHFEAQTVAPEPLLAMVSNLSSATVEGPRTLPGVLHRKMHEIAELHNGEVPIYGRLFAQWIHFAFPHECPYPSYHSSSLRKEMFIPAWEVKKASSAEKLAIQHQASVASNQTLAEDPDEQYEAMWDDMEVLHLIEVRKHSGARTGLNGVIFLTAIVSASVYLAGMAKQMRQVNNPMKANWGKSERLMV